MPAKKLIAGNWKMNGLKKDGLDRAQFLSAQMSETQSDNFDLLICPPTTLLFPVADIVADSGILLGGQDCHSRESGAYTGDTSPLMLRDAGCTHVITGHSERRQGHSETSPQVSHKARAAHAAGLVAIICIGETEPERQSGFAHKIISAQLKESLPDTATEKNTVIAYEPVWAIGTGKSATSKDISEMHAYIRGHTKDILGGASDQIPILYGGSVKSENARDILHLEGVDGVLVGGASLKPEEFWAIASAA